MYEQLKNQEERIVNLEGATIDNTESIKKLLETESKQEERIAKMESNYINLENTIMKENRETRQSYQSQTDRQWEFIEQMTGVKESESKRSHEFKMHRTSQITGIILKVVGGGGIIYLLVQDFILTK